MMSDANKLVVRGWLLTAHGLDVVMTRMRRTNLDAQRRLLQLRATPCSLEGGLPLTIYRSARLIAAPLAGFLVLTSQAAAQVPDAIAAPGEAVVATVHAEGAQVYECQADSGGKLVWQFREPIATLLLAGKTVGRHYAGPNWQHSDGSAVVGKVVARAAGATAKDIPWLKLEVTERRGSGMLSGVTTVQRINTEGGAAEGGCDRIGAFRSVAYAADYLFLRK
jgi:Protein of unknown function (DUF3455)